jgi:crossover junction endodeoxyribonuclease RusA
VTDHEIDLPLWKGKPPLTLNQRLHHQEKARRTKRIRESVGWQAMAMRLGHARHISVQLHYKTGDRRRRDSDNLVPSMKPAVDALVDAGLVPDDDPLHVTTIMPAIYNGAGPRRLWITVHITEET